MKIFESLYALYGRIDREAERVELVLGDGILSWRRADGGFTIRFSCSACNCSSTHRYLNSRFPKRIIQLSCTLRCSNR